MLSPEAWVGRNAPGDPRWAGFGGKVNPVTGVQLQRLGDRTGCILGCGEIMFCYHKDISFKYFFTRSIHNKIAVENVVFKAPNYRKPSILKSKTTKTNSSCLFL